MIDQALVADISEWLGVIAVVLLLAANPRFKKRALVFKYPEREALFALALYGVILVLAVIFYIVTGGKLAVSPQADIPEGLWQRLFIAGLSLLPFLAALRLRGQPLLSAGWSRAMLKPSLYLGLALAFLTIFLRARLYSILDGVSSNEANMLFLWGAVCLSEESVFRGYIQPRLSARWGEHWGWLFTALMFLIWSLPRLLTSPVVLVSAVLLVAVQALVLGWIAQKSGHVLVLVIYRTISEWIRLI